MGQKLKVITTSLSKNPGPGSYEINQSTEVTTNGGTGKYSGAKWGFSKDIRRINHDIVKKAINQPGPD